VSRRAGFSSELAHSFREFRDASGFLRKAWIDGHGHIRVDERLETTAPGVWAIGECAGSPQFTHVSVDDFQTIRANLAGGNAARTAGWCRTACSPTLRWRVAKLPASAVLRTQTTDEKQGHEGPRGRT
jgi:Pyridine nucleotide-disulphide oxidoreductase